jgi:hypothetical protein
MRPSARSRSTRACGPSPLAEPVMRAPRACAGAAAAETPPAPSPTNNKTKNEACPYSSLLAPPPAAQPAAGPRVRSMPLLKNLTTRCLRPCSTTERWRRPQISSAASNPTRAASAEPVPAHGASAPTSRRARLQACCEACPPQRMTWAGGVAVSSPYRLIPHRPPILLEASPASLPCLCQRQHAE